MNDVHSVELTPGGVLWAATSNGAVRWDLSTGTYVRLSSADGLGGDYVADLAVAPDGTLWFATSGGVTRLSGSTWTVYEQEAGLPGGSAQSVAVALDGAVWLGTTEGVARFDGHEWTRLLEGARTWDIAVAADGEVWFANGADGVRRYSPDTDTWTTYGVDAGLPPANVLEIATGQGGSVWAWGLWEGLYAFDGTAWREVDSAGGLVCDIAIAPDGNPWLGTCGSLHYSGGSLLRFDSGAWADVGQGDGLGSLPIRSVVLEDDGLIAAGTNQGIKLFRQGEWHMLRGGPARDVVTAVAATPDGAAWFAFGDSASDAAGGGVSRFDGRGWQYFLGNANVQALAVGPDGSLWAGAGCTVERFDGRDFQTVAGCDDLGVAGNVLDLAFAADGTLWAATGMGLARLSGGLWIAEPRLVHSLAVAPDGSIWAAGWEGRQGSEYVAHFDGVHWEVVPQADPSGGAIGSLAAMPDGSLWGTAGERGLAHLDGQLWSFVGSAGALDLAGARGLSVAPDGALWVAAVGGVAQWADGTWRGTPTLTAVNAVAVAPDGTVWAATQNGAARLDR